MAESAKEGVDSPLAAESMCVGGTAVVTLLFSLVRRLAPLSFLTAFSLNITEQIFAVLVRALTGKPAGKRRRWLPEQSGKYIAAID